MYFSSLKIKVVLIYFHLLNKSSKISTKTASEPILFQFGILLFHAADEFKFLWQVETIVFVSRFCFLTEFVKCAETAAVCGLPAECGFHAFYRPLKGKSLNERVQINDNYRL